MPSAINPLPAIRSLAFRPRPAITRRAAQGIQRPVCRTFADDKKHNAIPEAQGNAVGPNMQQQEHVSEEAAKMAKITGGQGPDIEGHGTPVQDVRIAE